MLLEKSLTADPSDCQAVSIRHPKTPAAGCLSPPGRTILPHHARDISAGFAPCYGVLKSLFKHDWNSARKTSLLYYAV
ncbi:hypothetical protein HGG75_26750 [Ochrobactrum pseudogrignonense]|nr:hypothetical protein [Brucella pseudogrignonensis]